MSERRSEMKPFYASLFGPDQGRIIQTQGRMKSHVITPFSQVDTYFVLAQGRKGRIGRTLSGYAWGKFRLEEIVTAHNAAAVRPLRPCSDAETASTCTFFEITQGRIPEIQGRTPLKSGTQSPKTRDAPSLHACRTTERTHR